MTMTRARTVGCLAKDLVLNTVTSSMSSTPLMMSGGKPEGSHWMGTARRWASFPASGGKDDFCASEQACTHGREGAREGGRQRKEGRECVC